MSLQDLDFVFSVKAKTPEKEISSIISALLTAGFHIQARPGTSNSILLFVQLATVSYTELVQKDLVKCFEFGVTVKDDAPADRNQLIFAYLTSSKHASGVGITPGKGQWAAIETIMPITGYLADGSLPSRVKKNLFSASLVTSPLRKAYGTGVALYFEFLKHYIGYLILLSIFGVIAYVKSKNYSMTYTFINLIGGVLFILSWKRKEKYLTSVWGVQNSHKLEQYDAELSVLNKDFEIKSSFTHVERHDGTRFLKQWAFIPVALCFVAVLFIFQMLCFFLEIFSTEVYAGPLQVVLKLIPTVALSVFVVILNIIYNFTVTKYLTWEKHDNEYTRYDSFLAKTFVINFLTGYVPLLITSFVYLPFAHLVENYLPDIENAMATQFNGSKFMLHYLAQVKRQEEFTMNQDRLNSQYFFFIVINQIIQFGLKYGLPLVTPKIIKVVKVKLLKKQPEHPIQDVDSDEAKWLTAVRAAIALPEFKLHDDFRGLALQFGYLSMFGPVWTLAPLICLLFNIVSLKLDVLKLTNGKYFRPPLPSRKDLIHPWDQAFFILAWLGSVVSPIVTSFYRNGTKPPKSLGQLALDKASVNISSPIVMLGTLFLAEHLFFALYFVGSKASKLVLSKEEELNNFLDNDLRVRKDYYSSLVLLKADTSNSPDWKDQTVEQILKSAVPVEQAEASEASNMSDVAVNLRSRKGKSDKIIEVVNADGSKTEAIIDGPEHIPMEDVKALEKKLAAHAKETSKQKKAK